MSGIWYLFNGAAFACALAVAAYSAGSWLMIKTGATPHRERMVANAWGMVGATWGLLAAGVWALLCGAP